MKHQNLILVAITDANRRYENVAVAYLNTEKSTADGAVYEMPINATPVLPPHAAPDGKDWMHTPDAECEWTLVDVYDDVPVYDKHTAQRIAPPDFGQPLAEHMTLTEPPHETGKVTYWDDSIDAWSLRIDYTGVQCWSTTDPRQSVVLAVTDWLIPDGYTDTPQPSPAHDWDDKKSVWVLNKTKQAELDAAARAQAEKQAVEAVKHALQSHIDSVAIGLGFSGGNAVMLYAGFANAFQQLAQAFGTWEADIWEQANQYMAQVKVGDAPMLMPEQAVERIPKFEFAGA